MEAAGTPQREPMAGATGRTELALQEIARQGWKPADPAPLGLAGFAMTTFVLSMFNADLVSHSGELVVLGLAIAYGGLAQLLAGMWEFRNSNTFGAVAFSSYGAFWISFFILLQQSLPPHAIGLYLWAWGGFTAYMFLASLRTTAAVAAVLLLLTITYVLLAIGFDGGNSTVMHWGGYLGIATAAAAWYASFAAVINSTFARTVLPVFPLTPGPRVAATTSQTAVREPTVR